MKVYLFKDNTFISEHDSFYVFEYINFNGKSAGTYNLLIADASANVYTLALSYNFPSDNSLNIKNLLPANAGYMLSDGRLVYVTETKNQIYVILSTQNSYYTSRFDFSMQGIYTYNDTFKCYVDQVNDKAVFFELLPNNEFVKIHFMTYIRPSTVITNSTSEFVFMAKTNGSYSSIQGCDEITTTFTLDKIHEFDVFEFQFTKPFTKDNFIRITNTLHPCSFNLTACLFYVTIQQCI